jgi:hypothetical protein
MGHRIECSFCGKSYKLSDKYAGRRLKCKECGEPLSVPQKQPPNGDGLTNSLQAAGEEQAAYQPAADGGLPPRTVRSKTKTTKQSSGNRSRLTAQKVYLIQGLVAGGMLGGIFSLVSSIFNFGQTGWVLLLGNTVLGAFFGAIFGGVVMFAAGKFDSALAGCIAGVLVMVPMSGCEAFINQLLGNETFSIYVHLLLGIPKGVIGAFWIFKTAKDIEVNEAVAK